MFCYFVPLFPSFFRSFLLVETSSSLSFVFSLFTAKVSFSFLLHVYTVFINGGRAEQPGFECLKARLGRPRTDHKTKNMASSSRASDENARVILTENDIPGASLAGRILLR